MSREPARATAGPWRAIPEPAELNVRVVGYRGQHVATVWSGNERALEVAEANAARIVAAGDLLEALEALREWCYSNVPYFPNIGAGDQNSCDRDQPADDMAQSIDERAQRAIEKARGVRHGT